MNMIKPTNSSHYYDENGFLMFDATLREAKKYNLLVSVTTFLSIIHKYQLENWKQEQILLSALTTPKIDCESESEYIKRVIEGSQEISTDAKDFGSTIHKLIERYINGDTIDILQYGENITKAFCEVQKYVDNNSLKGETEKVVVNNKYGYAGTIDYVDSKCIIDWKTQKVKNKEYKRSKDDPYQTEKNGLFYRPCPIFYDEWKMQLGAYGLCLLKRPEKYISVIIDSETHGRIFVKEFTEEEIKWGEEAALTALKLWQMVKKYKYRREC
mgnify:CR=1 FL=1